MQRAAEYCAADEASVDGTRLRTLKGCPSTSPYPNSAVEPSGRRGRQPSDRHRQPSAAGRPRIQSAAAVQAQPPLSQPAQEPKAPCSTREMGETPLALGRVACSRALCGATAVAKRLSLHPAHPDSPAPTPSADVSARRGSIPGLRSPGWRWRLGWWVRLGSCGDNGVGGLVFYF
ncbi:unnamed protein product [Boreogadus saida]